MSRHTLLLLCLLVPASAGAQASQTIIPWPGGTVPIQFDVSTSPEQQARLFTACRQWEAVANVRCVRRTTEVPFVQVIRFGRGCVAGLGAPAPPPPPVPGVPVLYFNGYTPHATYLNLAEGCYGGWHGDHLPGPGGYYALVHELGHVFGLIHEHQREDRDLYLQVDESLVDDNLLPAYRKVRTNLPQTTPYDYHSVMHYPQTGAFIGVPSGIELGGVQVSALDGEDLAAIYGPKMPQEPLQLELLPGGGNPVQLRWRGGNGHPYHLLAGSVPGMWDYGIFSQGFATSLTAVIPAGVSIYVTLATGTGWHDAEFGPTVLVLLR